MLFFVKLDLMAIHFIIFLNGQAVLSFQAIA